MGVVDLEGRWKLRRRRSDKHQVAMAADSESVGNGLIGFHFVEIQASLDSEVAHGTAKVVGTGGKGFYVDLYGFGV